MSGSRKDGPEAEIEQTKRLTFAPLSESYEENIKIILDNLQPIETRIQAIGCAEFAFYRSSAFHVFRVNDGKNEASPDVEAYFKALVFIAKEPMSREDVFIVLKYVHSALNGELIRDMDLADRDTYNAISAPFSAQICSNTIKSFIESRNDSEIVRKCTDIFQNLFYGNDFGDDFPKERIKCGDIAVASGLIPTLTHIMTSHSIYGTLGDTASSEELCSSALLILRALMALDLSELRVLILVETAHPVFDCLLNSSTEGILSSGSSVISKFLSRTLGKKTVHLKFKNGKTGVQCVLLVIVHCSNFMKTDYCEAMMHDVLEIIRRLAKLIIHREDFKALSKIMLNMLKDFETESMQLLLIFADLMYINCERVLDSLSELSGSIPGKDYVRDVIERGLCTRYESFHESRRTRVNQALLNFHRYAEDKEAEGEDLPEEIIEGETNTMRVSKSLFI